MFYIFNNTVIKTEYFIHNLILPKLRKQRMNNTVKDLPTKQDILVLIKKFREVDGISTEHSVFKKVLEIEKAISQDIGFQKTASRNNTGSEQCILTDDEFPIKEREIVCWLYFNGLIYDRIFFAPNNIRFIYKTKR